MRGACLLGAGGGKWEGFTSQPNCLGNFITVLGEEICSLLAQRGRGEGVGQAGAGGAGAKAHSKVTRDGGWWWSLADISSKYALQKIFQAGKAGKRSWRLVCGEAAGGSLVPIPSALYSAMVMGSELFPLAPGRGCGQG